MGLAWIRPRLVEFIACNLHTLISIQVFGDAHAQERSIWEPYLDLASLGR